MEDLIERILHLECQVAFLQNNIMKRLASLEEGLSGNSLNSSSSLSELQIVNPHIMAEVESNAEVNLDRTVKPKPRSMYDVEFYVPGRKTPTPRYIWGDNFSRFPTDCDIHEIDKYGNNILCHSNNIKLTNLAIESGVDVNHRNLNGLTPLHFAYRNPDVINLLIIAGGNVNGRSNDGKTPIFLAKKVPLLKTLVSYGANINIKDCKGKSIKDITKNVDILEYLNTIDS